MRKYDKILMPFFDYLVLSDTRLLLRITQNTRDIMAAGRHISDWCFVFLEDELIDGLLYEAMVKIIVSF